MFLAVVDKGSPLYLQFPLLPESPPNCYLWISEFSLDLDLVLELSFSSFHAQGVPAKQTACVADASSPSGYRGSTKGLQYRQRQGLWKGSLVKGVCSPPTIPHGPKEEQEASNPDL